MLRPLAVTPLRCLPPPSLPLPRSSLCLVPSSTAQTGDKGAVALGRSLCSNCRLRTLYLSGNLIREAGARAIARGLSQNPSLTVLHLTGNSIGPEGASALAEGIVVNRTLTKVSEDLLQSGSQSHAVGVGWTYPYLGDHHHNHQRRRSAPASPCSSLPPSSRHIS